MFNSCEKLWILFRKSGNVCYIVLRRKKSIEYLCSWMQSWKRRCCRTCRRIPRANLKIEPFICIIPSPLIEAGVYLAWISVACKFVWHRSLHCPGSSGLFFFQRLHARKWNNFAIVLVVLVFVLNKNIGNIGLLRDLTLGVSHDNNYREEIYTFM